MQTNGSSLRMITHKCKCGSCGGIIEGKFGCKCIHSGVDRIARAHFIDALQRLSLPVALHQHTMSQLDMSSIRVWSDRARPSLLGAWLLHMNYSLEWTEHAVRLWLQTYNATVVLPSAAGWQVLLFCWCVYYGTSSSGARACKCLSNRPKQDSITTFAWSSQTV